MPLGVRARSVGGAVFALATLTAAACSIYREDLNRGQRLYEENQFEDALAIWRVLEPDRGALRSNDRSRYDYFRGMTDYRLGFRTDSRHWLALAKANEAAHPGGLRADWRDRMEQALDDLNQAVYARESSRGVWVSGHGASLGVAKPGGGARSERAPSAGVVDDVRVETERYQCFRCLDQAAVDGSPSKAEGDQLEPLPPDRCGSNSDCPADYICDGATCKPL